MTYIKPLDSLRAIAVLLVLIEHWIPAGRYIHKFEPGALGVEIFFVLSGFLITQILLQARKEAEAREASKKNVLLRFYARRALRIFPIYYLTIGLTLLLNERLQLNFSLSELLASSTYTTNFYIFSVKAWPAASSHFWSLAVEEQFYLFWPFAMLFLPVRLLPPCILLFLLLGILSQPLLADQNFGYVLPHTCIDCLGMGALLAWLVTFKPELLPSFNKGLRVAAFLCTGLIVYEAVWDSFFVSVRPLRGIFGTWLISYILLFNQRKNGLFSLLNSRLLTSIGKVSYGIYLYHLLFGYLAFRFWAKYVYKHLDFMDPAFYPWLFLTVNGFILLLICGLSWRFVEKPVLSLKKRFAYLDGEARVKGSKKKMPEKTQQPAP